MLVRSASTSEHEKSTFAGKKSKTVAEILAHAQSTHAKSYELEDHSFEYQKKVLTAPNRGLTNKPLPLSNNLPTDSSAAMNYVLSSKTLLTGFPDGTVVCWAWGLPGCPEWRRYDHVRDEEKAETPVRCISAVADGSFASCCDSGRVCYLPQPGADFQARRLELPFFRGARVVDKHRLGIVAVTAEMSTARDLYGTSVRIRWDGEDNLDEMAQDMALEKLQHYYPVASVLLTTWSTEIQGDGSPLVIIGTSNGAVLGYAFPEGPGATKERAADNSGHRPPTFAFSPFYKVDLDEEILNDPNQLKHLPLDGPPLTSLAQSTDDPRTICVGTGRLASPGNQTEDPLLMQLNILEQSTICKTSLSLSTSRHNDVVPKMTGRSTGRSLDATRSKETAAEFHDGIASVGTSIRHIAGSSRAVFCLQDAKLFCWRGNKAPSMILGACDALCIALSADGEWLATGHKDCSVKVWGPLAQCIECMDGLSSWNPRVYKPFHSLPVSSVAFIRGSDTERGQWLLASCGGDKELNQLVVGSRVASTAFVSEKVFTPRAVGDAYLHANARASIRCVWVSSDRQLLCVGIGDVIQVFCFRKLCLSGKFKLLAELAGHDDSVLCLCMNNKPGDKRLFTGSSDNTVRIWDLGGTITPDRQQSSLDIPRPQVIGPLVSSVTAVCVDRTSGVFLIAGLANGTILVYNWKNPDIPPQELEYHEQEILSISTHDARRFVSGCADNILSVWERDDVGTFDKQPQFQLKSWLRNHDGDVNSVYLGVKGRRIVTVSTDTTVMLWETDDLYNPKVLRGHQAAVMVSCTSTDLQTVISGDQSGLVIEWDVISGTVRRSFNARTGDDIKLGECDSSSEAAEVRAICLVERDPDSASNKSRDEIQNCTWLVIATPNAVRVKEMYKSERQVLKGHINHISCCTMSPDNNYVVSASWDTRLIIWEAISATQKMVLSGHMGPVLSCDVNSDCSMLISGSADTRIIIWDFQKAEKLHVLTGYHDDLINSIKVVPHAQGDTLRFASGGMDHKVNVFGMTDRAEPRRIAILHNNVGVRCVIGPRHANGFIGIGDSNGRIILWKPNYTEVDVEDHLAHEASSAVLGDSTDTHDELQTSSGLTRILMYHQQTVKSVYFSEDGGKLLATSSDGEASVWCTESASNTQMLKTFTHMGTPRINCGRFSEQNGDKRTPLRVLLGCDDGKVYIWDYRSHIIEKVLDRHKGPILDLEISKDSKIVVSAAKGNPMLLRWNLVRSTADMQLVGHRDGVGVVHVSHNTNQVVTGAKDNRIMLWNLKGPSAGKAQLDLLLHSGNVSCLCLSKDGRHLLSGGWDTNVCLTDLATPQCLRVFRGHVGAVLSCAITGADESVIVSCCRGGVLIRWDIVSGSHVWRASVGSPLRCLAMKPDGMMIINCDKGNKIQAYDCEMGQEVGSPLEEQHRGIVVAVSFTFNYAMLCSASAGGEIVFWDARCWPFAVKSRFSCEAMEDGIESMDISNKVLLLSTVTGQVLLFDVDPECGIPPDAVPRRVWKHHTARIPSVQVHPLQSQDMQDMVAITGSYDSRVNIHPLENGTSLWFSWLPLMNAVKAKQYKVFKQLIWNQPDMCREKVYPLGWTLMHALAASGDLTAAQQVFELCKQTPLGFPFDAEDKTPLDIAFEMGKTQLLEFMLSQASSWPKHVTEYNTASIGKLIPMNLPSMPAFLDSRLASPLPYPGEEVPQQTYSDAEFTAIQQQGYFEYLGIGGGDFSSLSKDDFCRFKIAVSQFADIYKTPDDDDDSDSDDKQIRIPKSCFTPDLSHFVEGHVWMLVISGTVLADVVLTILLMLVDIDETNLLVATLSYTFLGVFVVDIILRIGIDRLEFIMGPHRYTNVFEFVTVLICVIVELVDLKLPVSIARLLRPVMRILRVVRVFLRLFVLIMKQRKARHNDGATPIDAICFFVNDAMNHDTGLLKYIVASRQPELFTSTAVMAILEFKWAKYAKRNHLSNLTLYLLHVACWMAYTGCVYVASAGNVNNSMKDILGIVTGCLSFRYTIIEIKRFLFRGPLDYLTSFRNISSFVSYTMLIVTCLLELVDRHRGVARKVAAMSTPLVWLETLHYLRGFRGTGALVRLIVRTLYDMRHFMLIMMIMTVALLQAFLVLGEDGGSLPTQPMQLTWQVYNSAWLGATWEDDALSDLQHLLYVFMTLFMLIILLNMLIAIMGDTFQRVMEVRTVEFYFSFAELIYDLEMLMSNKELADVRYFPKYLMYSTIEDANKGEEEEK